MQNDFLVEGPITPDFISKTLDALSTETSIGAHNFFLGQIRQDTIDGKVVAGIDYSAYAAMANEHFAAIIQKASVKFPDAQIIIKHSIGLVKVSEISLFVVVSSPHRRACIEGLDYTVEAIKAEVPVFGKEILADDSHVWKVNK